MFDGLIRPGAQELTSLRLRPRNGRRGVKYFLLSKRDAHTQWMCGAELEEITRTQQLPAESSSSGSC
jgi:hypothetical protein